MSCYIINKTIIEPKKTIRSGVAVFIPQPDKQLYCD